MGRRILQKKETSKSKLEKQQDALSASVSMQEQELSNLDTQSENAEKKLQKTNNSIIIAEERKNLLDRQISKLELTNKELEDTKIKLKNDIAVLESKMSDKQALLDSDFAAYENELENKRNELAHLQKQQDDLLLSKQNERADLERKISELRSTAEKEQSNLDALQKQKKALQDDIIEAKESLAKIEAEKKEVSITVQQQISLLNQKQRETGEADAKLKQKQNQIKDAIHEEEVLDTSIASKKKELGDYESKMLALQRKDDSLEKKAKRLRIAYTKAGLPIDF